MPSASPEQFPGCETVFEPTPRAARGEVLDAFKDHLASLPRQRRPIDPEISELPGECGFESAATTGGNTAAIAAEALGGNLNLLNQRLAHCGLPGRTWPSHLELRGPADPDLFEKARALAIEAANRMKDPFPEGEA